MGLIGNSVSVASANGYTKDKVILAKRYLREIGKNKRNFPIERLVEMYNTVKGTREKAEGCRPCQASKFYNGISNYALYGEMTLVNTHKCTREELDIDIIDRMDKMDEPVIDVEVVEVTSDRSAIVGDDEKKNVDDDSDLMHPVAEETETLNRIKKIRQSKADWKKEKKERAKKGGKNKD